MKTNKKFKEFRKEIVDYIDKSKMVKSNQSYKVKQEEKEGYKRLFIGKSIKREITQDALWFVDRSFLKFEICLDIQNGGINIWKYSIQWESDDKKNIYYLRYEWDEKIFKPNHPLGHLHINDYVNPRLPTGKLDFGQIFQCIEIWIEKRNHITGGKIL